MAYMLKDKSAFWRAQKQIKTTNPQDPKPQNFVSIFLEQDSQLTQASPRIPEAILKAFCPSVEITKISSCGGKSVVLQGVTLEAINEVLTWMRDCSKANLVIPFPWIYDQPYYSYIQIKHVAKALHFDGLSDEMQKRSIKLINTQVHTDDIQKIYQSFPSEGDGSAHRKMVSHSIAKAIQERRLKAKSTVEKIRDTIPDFYEDVLARLPEAARPGWIKSSNVVSTSPYPFSSVT